MGKGKVKLKKIFIIFLLIVFLFQTTYVFALEIKYPPVPGAFTPQEIEQKIKDKEIDEEDRLPLYFKYYFNLSLIIVVLICLGVLIFGATLYLLSPAKPVVLVSARRWIFSGLLGLLILFSSYLVLVTINPQLALLRLPKERAEIPPGRVVPLKREALTYFAVPTGRLIETNLGHIKATTTRVIAGITHWPDCDDDRTDCWGGDKGPRDTVKYCTSDNFSFTWCQWRSSPDGCQNNEVMVAITWPKCEGGQMDCWGGQAKIKCCGPVKLTGCYTTSTPSCKEGDVLHRITHWPDCAWGKTDCWDSQRDKARCCTPKKVKFTACYELQSPVVEGPEINKFVSELEKVKARSEDLKRNMELLEEATEACSCGKSNCHTGTRVRLDYTKCWCSPDENQCNIDCDKDLIVERMEKVKENIGKLEAEKMRLVTLQIPLIIDYLEMKKAGLLMTLPEDEIDYGQFALIKYLLEIEGEKIETISFKGWPAPVITEEIAGGKVTLPDPATFYFYPDKWENQQILAETQRLNPILIFSNTSPAELNKQIAERVKEALGDDIFNLLSESDWEEIVRKSLEEGTFEALEDFVIALADAVSKISAKTISEKLIEKAKEKTSMLLERKLALIAQAQAQETDLIREKIEVLLTTELEERLPPFLRDTLSEDILDFVDEFTGGDIKNLFYADFYDLLSQDIKDSFSIQIADLSPALTLILSLRVIEVLPFTIVADFLTDINDFLTERIEEIKSIITQEIQIIVDSVVDVITQVLVDNLPSWLETIILALMEGLELVINEIVRGYVEVYIMYYLDSFLKDVYNFPEKLDDLLTLVLKDILPKEIRRSLERDIESLLPDDARDFLHENFIDFLPEKTREILTQSLKKFLPEEIRDILSETFVSLLGIEFIFEKTLYDFFPGQLKNIFEEGCADLFPDELRDPLLDFLPDEAKRPFVELTEAQRRFLFYSSILGLLPEQLLETFLGVLGMEDDRVMDILPSSVGLLVQIIEDYLRPDERPELLNELIRILKRPLTTFIRDDLNNPGLADTLNTPSYRKFPQDVQDNLNKSFADHFSELNDRVFDPTSDSLIDIIDKHSGSNISQALYRSAFSLLPQEVRDQLNLRLKNFLPGWIINQRLFELLPDNWLGSTADFLGLTDEDIEEAVDETMEEIDLDEEVNAIIQTISDKMASAFTNSLIKNLAAKTGQKISQEKADELAKGISEDINLLIEKAWSRIMSEGLILDSLKNL